MSESRSIVLQKRRREASRPILASPILHTLKAVTQCPSIAPCQQIVIPLLHINYSICDILQFSVYSGASMLYRLGLH